MTNIDQLRADLAYLNACLLDLNARAETRSLDDAESVEWTEGLALRDSIAADLAAYEARQAEALRIAAERPQNVISGAFEAPAVIVRNTPSLGDVRAFATPGELRDLALRSLEHLPHATDEQRAGIEQTLVRAENRRGDVARHIAATSSPEYVSAFGKALSPGGAALIGPDEARALELARAASLTDAAGGYAIPPHLDPSLIYTGNGATNPVRNIARKVVGTADVWNGISHAGVSASFDAEAAEVSDDTPTLAQPSITARTMRVFVPFSLEIGGDWPSIQAALGEEMARAKNNLEATVFVTGAAGSNQPIGIVTALTGTSSVINEATNETFTLPDVYALFNALPAEYEDNATWLAHKAIYNLIRQFDTYGGAALWETLGGGRPSNLLGSPAVASSAMDSAFDAAATADNFLAVYGDFDNYVIYDRVGMSVELIPHMFHTSNNLPSGQRGLFAWCRIGADSVNDNAFRMLNLTTAA